MQSWRRSEVILIIALAIVGMVLLTGASVQKGILGASTPDDTLYQYSTIDALMLGLYDGGVTMQNLTTRGDFGIGTFDRLDGEMIVLDGMVYQARADGTVSQAAPANTTPFAAVAFFDTDRSYQLNRYDNLSSLTSTIDTFLPGGSTDAVSKTGRCCKRAEGVYPLQYHRHGGGGLVPGICAGNKRPGVSPPLHQCRSKEWRSSPRYINRSSHALTR